MNENMTTRVVTELGNRCLVLYRSETNGQLFAKHVRDFPPRRTYPIAVLAADGSIVRLTSDPLPDQETLAAHLGILRATTAPTPTPTAGPTPPWSGWAGLPTTSPADFATRVERDFILALDVSGGMDPARSERWLEVVGNLTHCRQVIVFDGAVSEHTPGQPVRRGGNTDFRPVQDYVESYPAEVDVVVLTDGYGPHLSPAHPDRWTWVVTVDGEPWPARAATPMRTIITK